MRLGFLSAIESGISATMSPIRCMWLASGVRVHFPEHRKANQLWIHRMLNRIDDPCCGCSFSSSPVMFSLLSKTSKVYLYTRHISERQILSDSRQPRVMSFLSGLRAIHSEVVILVPLCIATRYAISFRLSISIICSPP